MKIIDTMCENGTTIRATCHHDITNKLAFSVTLKDTTVDYNAEKFVNCVSYSVVCFRCLIDYLLNRDILFTPKSVSRWLDKK